MRRVCATITMLTVAAGTLVAAAQAQTPEVPRQVKQYADAFLGDWVMESEMKEDSPDGKLKKGDALKVTASIKWGTNKTSLTMNWAFSVNKVTTMSGTTVTGWDPARKRVTRFGFGPAGMLAITTFTRKDDKHWVWRTVQAGPEGKKSTSVRTIEIGDDGNTHTHTTTGRTDDQENPLPDRISTFVRVKS